MRRNDIVCLKRDWDAGGFVPAGRIIKKVDDKFFVIFYDGESHWCVENELVKTDYKGHWCKVKFCYPDWFREKICDTHAGKWELYYECQIKLGWIYIDKYGNYVDYECWIEMPNIRKLKQRQKRYDKWYKRGVVS